ncbi:MAG: DUF3052 domain-containing protein [Thermomicrobiales bacterium]
MTVGYSGKPLIEKLGLREGFRARIVDAPDQYWALLGPLPPSVALVDDCTPNLDLDFIHCFTTRRDDLEATFPALQSQLGQRGMIWISWPKATVKTETDLNENIVRAIGLRNGLVDVKVCAVDAQWSGLKFVRRLKDRS